MQFFKYTDLDREHPCFPVNSFTNKCLKRHDLYDNFAKVELCTSTLYWYLVLRICSDFIPDLSLLPFKVCLVRW